MAVIRTVATGYGRSTIEAATDTLTEIACHAAAVHFHHPRPVTVVDIGVQIQHLLVRILLLELLNCYNRIVKIAETSRAGAVCMMKTTDY